MNITTEIILGIGSCGPTDCQLWVKYNNKKITLAVDENDTYDMLSWISYIVGHKGKGYSNNSANWNIKFSMKYFAWKVMKLIIEDYWRNK